tara:strand:+ start:58 stop:549 length:492 start_codon:yes stop_codon:yes gene_type:complete
MSNKRNNKKVSKTAAQDMEDAYQMESGYNLAMINEELLTPEIRKKLELMQDFIPESAGKRAGRKLYKQRKSKNREAQTDDEKKLKAALKVIAQNKKNNKKPKPSPDYTKGLPDREMEIKMGVPNQKYMDATSTDAEGPTKKKKYGGKINYRMGGGQVVDSSYD